MRAKPQTVVDAGTLISLLAERHAKDVFIAECKNGPTWGSRYQRLDAWVLCKTWSPWTTVGYEVKISRHDFTQDQKWTGYLPVCHEFYFVCPAGLIKAPDLPEGIGLIWASPNGGRLYTKVKATKRKPDPEALCELMSYALMSRAVVVADMHEAAQAEPPAQETEAQRIARMRESAETAAAKKELAWFVNQQVRLRLLDAESERKVAANDRVLVEEFRARLASAGIVWKDNERGWSNEWEVRREIDVLCGQLHEQTLGQLRQAGRLMTEAVDTIERLRRQRETELAQKESA